MARPKKQGLDYFPLDVDLDYDDKLAMLIGEFGYKGELLWIKLLAYLYKNHGYFIPWDEVEQLKFAKRVGYIGASVNLINEVVVRSVKWGLFDETVFNETQAATSVRIQTTWLDVSRKRKDRNIDPKIWLLGQELIPAETKLIPEVIGNRNNSVPKPPLIPPETPQSKVKESKEEINKEKNQEGLTEPQEVTFWKREQNTFLTNRLFFEKFCVAKRLAPAAARLLQEQFLTNLDLVDDIKEAPALQDHFIKWFTKGQRDGFIDQQGVLKNATPPEQSQTVRNVIEERTDDFLKQFH